MMKKQSIKIKKTAQERQDEIFRKMSARQKIKLALDLSLLCLKLNRKNGKIRPRRTTY